VKAATVLHPKNALSLLLSLAAPDILKRGLTLIIRPRSPMHANLSAVLSRSTVSQNEALRESMSILGAGPPWRVPIRGWGAPSHGDLWLLAPVATQPKRIAPGRSRTDDRRGSLAAHGRSAIGSRPL